MPPESPKSFHKKEEQLKIDFEKAEFKDSKGRSLEDVKNISQKIRKYLDENSENIYFDDPKKEWRIIFNEKDRSLDEWLNIWREKQIREEREDDIETNSGWRR